MGKKIYKKSCGVIPVYEQGDKKLFLVIHQNNGHWAFPKGGMEEGESEEKTALRELGEEAGIGVSTLMPDSRILEEYDIEEECGLVLKQVVYFIGLVDGLDVKIQKEEIQDFAWLSFDKALARMTYNSTRRVLRKANDYLLSSNL